MGGIQGHFIQGFIDDHGPHMIQNFPVIVLYGVVVVHEEDIQPIGMWGRKRLRYIKEHHRALYTSLLISGKLNSHLAEINNRATEMFDRLVKQQAEKEGVTEQLKTQDQMAWVGAMNNIRYASEEIVLSELIYN